MQVMETHELSILFVVIAIHGRTLLDPNDPILPDSSTDASSKQSAAVTAYYASPTNPPVTNAPYRVILEQRSTLLRKAILLLLIIALGVSVMINFGVIAQYHS